MRNPSGVGQLVDENPRYKEIRADLRLSMGSNATASTINTRASSVLAPAQHNLGKTDSVLGAYDADDMQNEYIHSNIGQTNNKNFQNVPMPAKDAGLFNQNQMINQNKLHKKKMARARKVRKAKKYVPFVFLFFVLMAIVLAIAVLLNNNDSDENALNEVLGTSTLSPTNSPEAEGSSNIEIVTFKNEKDLTTLCETISSSFVACIENGQAVFCENKSLSRKRCSDADLTNQVNDRCQCANGQLLDFTADPIFCSVDEEDAICSSLETLSFSFTVDFDSDIVDVSLSLSTNLELVSILNECGEQQGSEELEDCIAIDSLETSPVEEIDISCNQNGLQIQANTCADEP